MTTLREAAQQTLEAEGCERLREWAAIGPVQRAAVESFLAAALEQQEQEPVAWMVYTLDGKSVCVTDSPADFTDQHRALPLYTTPPRRDLQCVCGAVWDGDEMVHAPYRREWVSLTDEERGQVYLSIPTNKFDVDYVVRAIEQRLKEKNT